MRNCDSCKAEIIWAVTENGKRMPIDPDPVKGGNVELVKRSEYQSPLAKVHGPITLFEHAEAEGERYVSHFMTCPSASQHRRSQ